MCSEVIITSDMRTFISINYFDGTYNYLSFVELMYTDPLTYTFTRIHTIFNPYVASGPSALTNSFRKIFSDGLGGFFMLYSVNGNSLIGMPTSAVHTIGFLMKEKINSFPNLKLVSTYSCGTMTPYFDTYTNSP